MSAKGCAHSTVDGVSMLDPSQSGTEFMEFKSFALRCELVKFQKPLCGVGKFPKETFVQYRKDPDWVWSHSELSTDMRKSLFIWMLEVCDAYAFSTKTAETSLCFVDIALARSRSLNREYFQLLGAAALLMASKLHEIHPFALRDAFEMCAETYSFTRLKILGPALHPVTPMDVACEILDMAINRQVVNGHFWLGTAPANKSCFRQFKKRLEKLLRTLTTCDESLRYYPTDMAFASVAFCGGAAAEKLQCPAHLIFPASRPEQYEACAKFVRCFAVCSRSSD